MSDQKFTDMRSVSFTKAQGIALDNQAAKEGRKAGNLIRLAVCEYLQRVEALPVPLNTSDIDDINEDEEEFSEK